jgi:tetratricopeptide (TPR) repeat protein
MSDPIVKGIKRSSSRPASRQTSASSAKGRTLGSKSTARPAPLVKRSAAEKAPARKATKSKEIASSKGKTAKKSAKSAPSQKKAAARSSKAASAAKKPTARKSAPAKPQKKAAKASTARPARSKTAKAVAERKQQSAPQPVKRQPTRDEAAALRAFERAHKEFMRGRFGEARSQFRELIERYPGASEVTARARTYLTVAEARLRTEISLPRDADSLYDRGVIELNRGEYVAAQEMFERALKREPEAAHIHYGLAATRARLGSIDSALESLQRALDLQPNLRVRAQHDHDLVVLRNDPDFERLVFAPRF